MGNIIPKLKWNLSNNDWENPTTENIGRSFCMCDFGTYLNDPYNGIDYIIIANGSRLENLTHSKTDMSTKVLRMDNVINHYKNLKGNFKIEAFVIDADAPIIESSKKLAQYIDHLSMLSTTRSVNVIGVSKCGAMSFYIPSFFKNEESFRKFNLFNVAVPYQGTKFASPTLIIPEIKKMAKEKFGDTFLANLTYNGLKNYYKTMCSNSHMDYDISVQDSLDEKEYIEVYDKSFLENLFSQENIEKIKRISSFKNFTTRTDKNTLPEAIATLNFWGIGLCLLNDTFFDSSADGLVPYDSQKCIDDIISQESIHLPSSHHDVNTNVRVCNLILEEVDKTISGPVLRRKL